MNNTFNFNRFGKLLAMDGKKYLRNFGITLAILCSLNVGTWLLTAVFGFTMPTFIRWMVIYVAVMLATILVPAKAFGDINLPREGVRYAMLPVSNLEKYLSYLLYCILTPVAVVFISWGIDSLLTLIPVGGFQNFIKSMGVWGLTMDFITQLSDPSVAFSPSDLGDEFVGFYDMMSKLDSQMVWSYIVGILFSLGLFMMGNLLFKTHKTGKTFGIMIGVSYVISMIMQTIMLTSNFRGFFIPADPNNVNLSAIGNMTTEFMTISLVLNIVLTLALYVGIFFKLKTQKY